MGSSDSEIANKQLREPLRAQAHLILVSLLPRYIYIYVVCECEWVCSACTHIILSVTNSRQFLHIFCRFFFRCCCCYSLANCQRSPLLCGRKLTSTNWLFYLHTNMLACNCRSRYIYICSVVSSHIGKTTATNGISATARSLVHPYIHTLQIAHLSFLLSFLSYLSTYNLVFMMLSSAWLTWGRRCELLYVIVIIENKLIINMLYALLFHAVPVPLHFGWTNSNDEYCPCVCLWPRRYAVFMWNSIPFHRWAWQSNAISSLHNFSVPVRYVCAIPASGGRKSWYDFLSIIIICYSMRIWSTKSICWMLHTHIV